MIYIWSGFTFIMLVLSFTSLPFWGIHALSEKGQTTIAEPEYIILMGGSGFPGKSTLLRIFYAARLGNFFSSAKIVAAFPGDTTQNNGMLNKIKHELILRGLNSNRIIFESQGTNTRWQALEIKNSIIQDTLSQILIVSSPWHIYRSVKVFQNLGYQHVGSSACFENDIKTSLNYENQNVKGKNFLPDVGDNQNLRYQFWNHLKYEITLLREYMAITYYKLQGWI